MHAVRWYRPCQNHGRRRATPALEAASTHTPLRIYTAPRNFFTMRTIVIRLTLLVTGILATAACSGNSTSASMTPAAPSPGSAIQAQSFSATALSAGSQATAHVVTQKHDDQDELEGVIASVDPAAHSIVVHDTTVTVPDTTVIRHGQTTLTLADLHVGDRLHVKGTKSGATLVASEIIVQRPESTEPDHVALTGPVSALAGTCPAVTFSVNGTTVTTTATTRFGDGTCAELTNGTTARVRGLRQSDGSVTTTRVFFEDNDTEGARAKGAVAGLQGACPAVTFTLGNITITTSAATRFRNGSCSQLAAGVQVTARGTAQPDGSIQAATVTLPGESGDHESDH